MTHQLCPPSKRKHRLTPCPTAPASPAGARRHLWWPLAGRRRGAPAARRGATLSKNVRECQDCFCAISTPALPFSRRPGHRTHSSATRAHPHASPTNTRTRSHARTHRSLAPGAWSPPDGSPALRRRPHPRRARLPLHAEPPVRHPPAPLLADDRRRSTARLFGRCRGRTHPLAARAWHRPWRHDGDHQHRQ